MSVADPGISEGGARPKLVATVRRGDGFGKGAVPPSQLRKFLKFRFKIVRFGAYKYSRQLFFRHDSIVDLNDSNTFNINDKLAQS